MKNSYDKPSLIFEEKFLRKGYRRIAGIDEAGRGPIAGPVVAASVILDQNNIPKGINDSKKLSPASREIIFHQIMLTAIVGIGIGDVEKIDSINILNATKYAMNLSVERLIGFGISNKETFDNACQYASGAIIGSAFINQLKKNNSDEAISSFVGSIINP